MLYIVIHCYTLFYIEPKTKIKMKKKHLCKDDIRVIQLVKKSDFKGAFEIIKNTHDSISPNSMNILLHSIENKGIEDAFIQEVLEFIWNSTKNNMEMEKEKTHNLISRNYFSIGDYEKARKTRAFIKSLRDYTPEFQYHYKYNIKEAFINFEKVMSKRWLLNNDIFNMIWAKKNEFESCILKKDFDMIFKVMFFNEGILSSSFFENQYDINEKTNYTCDNCNSKLRFIIPKTSQLQKITQNYNHIRNRKFMFQKLKNILDDNEIDCIIDGCNVLFAQNEAEGITKKSYERIMIMIENAIDKNYKPLLILHSRHKYFVSTNYPEDAEYINSLLDKYKKYIFYTPCGKDDDDFVIWASLYRKCHFISNDELKDHKFKMKIKYKNNSYPIKEHPLFSWKKNKRISYISDLNNITLNEPPKIMRKIQYNNNRCHIPLDNGKWACHDMTTY